MKKAPDSSGAIIDDVAHLAGVSTKTVSRVVNHEPNVREKTRQRVLQAIEELNYRPNPSARDLARNRTDIVGVVYDNPSDSYVMNVLRGVLGVCQQYHFSLLLNPCDYRDPALSEQIAALIDDRRLAGLILTPPVCDVPELISTLDRLGTSYVRIAPVDRDSAGIDVAVDDHSGAFEMTRHLLDLGHRRIGFIKGHPDHGATQQRYKGYCQALREAGLKVESDLVVQGQFSFESGRDCGRRLLDLRRRPTAIFASNDDMAAGVLHVANESGIQVPAEVSVAGYDDTPLSSLVWPSLTTVRQPIQDMARAAMEQLMAVLRPNHPELRQHQRHEVLRTELVLRDSTQEPPGAGRRTT